MVLWCVTATGEMARLPPCLAPPQMKRFFMTGHKKTFCHKKTFSRYLKNVGMKIIKIQVCMNFNLKTSFLCVSRRVISKSVPLLKNGGRYDEKLVRNYSIRNQSHAFPIKVNVKPDPNFLELITGRTPKTFFLWPVRKKNASNTP